MDHPNKRRRLAPKVPEPPVQPAHPPPYVPEQVPPPQHYPVQEVMSAPERQEFEAFARHLQDAAVLIHRQTQKSPYSDVFVLLLRWEEDPSVDQDLGALERVLRERYNYRTERWSIPPGPNPIAKLSGQMASFLEHARADHLLIIYYAGHGFVGADNQLYWASNPREDAAKLKWDGVRCLIEDAHSDVLLLLDTCAVKDAPLSGSHGLKQVLAACSPDQGPRDMGSPSFTSYLVDSLQLLAGRPFTVQRLYEDILAHRQRDRMLAQSRLTNGESKAPAQADRTPIYLSLTPGKDSSLSLAPLAVNGSQRQPGMEGDGLTPSKLSRDDQLIDPSTLSDHLTFDEPHVLVCTTFVGEASPDMAYYSHWVSNMPPLASKIKVESMFYGPPTILLISMPIAIWNVVQHDKVCCFLGYIGTHNIVNDYNRMVASTVINTVATAKDVEDGRILLAARAAAASSPALLRRDHAATHPNMYAMTPPRAPPNVVQHDPGVQALGPSAPHLANASLPGPGAIKEDVEDSAEMKEAAEQLKALSHNRHMSNESSPNVNHLSPNMPSAAKADDSASSHDANDSGLDDTQQAGEYGGGPGSASKTKARRALQKQTPKTENRCNLCTRAPFKDSSSLRKHIAAVHTRPFPCAFSFAGCGSTFGSKNEWKRHIASQHLCLHYYRCSSCPKATVDGKGNEFNRKDLFTQHLRRMHAPFAIKKNFSKTDAKLQGNWETYVRDMQASCLVTRRRPPQLSSCPRADCQSVFEGVGSWDDWTEHVGRHMEKGDGPKLGVDRLLAEWALEEGIIEVVEGGGEYRLVNQGVGSGGGGAGGGGNGGAGSGSDEKEGGGFGSSFVSDAPGPAEDGDEEGEEPAGADSPPGPREEDKGYGDVVVVDTASPPDDEGPDPASITVATAAIYVAAARQEEEKQKERERERERELEPVPDGRPTVHEEDRMDVDD